MENSRLTEDVLSRFGFRFFKKTSAHTARSMMLDELKSLFSYVHDPKATKEDYHNAIVIENCLGKRSEANRKISFNKLRYLYGLDSDFAVFRCLRYFWERDAKGKALLALFCAYARDNLLQLSAPVIFSLEEGQYAKKELFEEHIYKDNPKRFTEATLKSTVRNLRASWTKSGHLVDDKEKMRSRVQATSGSVAYSLFLGYLVGVRGQNLFSTDYMKLLDCPVVRCVELAENASRRGWIVFKRIGTVMEVQFPNLLTEQEREWIHE